MDDRATKKLFALMPWKQDHCFANSKGTIHIVFYIEWLTLNLCNADAILYSLSSLFSQSQVYNFSNYSGGDGGKLTFNWS